MKVKITEVLEKIIDVEAKSGKEALQIADNNYRAAKDGYVLDSGDFIGVQMEIIENE